MSLAIVLYYEGPHNHDVNIYALIAFGAVGPFIPLESPWALGMKEAVLPNSPGLFSTFGLLFADTGTIWFRPGSESLKKSTLKN